MPLIRLEYMVGVLSAVRHDTRQSSGGVSVRTIVDLVCVVPNTLYFTLKPLQKQSQRSPCLTAWRRGTMWQNLFMGRYAALVPTPSRSAAYVIYVYWFELLHVGKSKHVWMINLHKQLSIVWDETHSVDTARWDLHWLLLLFKECELRLHNIQLWTHNFCFYIQTLMLTVCNVVYVWQP